MNAVVVCAMLNVTVDDESIERNTELTSDEIKQLQQNMRYVCQMNSVSDVDSNEYDAVADADDVIHYNGYSDDVHCVPIKKRADFSFALCLSNVS